MASMFKTVLLGLVSILGLLGVGSCGNDEPAKAPTEEDLVGRYFDARDLGFSPIVFDGNPPLDVPASRPLGPPWPTVHGVAFEEALLAFIRESTGSEVTWPDVALEDRPIGPDTIREGGPVLAIRNHIVVARNTPAVIDAVGKVLDEIRASGDPVAHVEAQWQGP